MPRQKYLKLLTVLCLIHLAACGPGPAPVDTQNSAMITSGQALAEQLCSSCHTISESGESPRNDAPPLRTVLANYDSEALGDDFREHIHVGHPDMPDFDFSVKETDAILAFLKSIQESQD